jgi:hypothetical protein
MQPSVQIGKNAAEIEPADDLDVNAIDSRDCDSDVCTGLLIRCILDASTVFLCHTLTPICSGTSPGYRNRPDVILPSILAVASTVTE